MADNFKFPEDAQPIAVVPLDTPLLTASTDGNFLQKVTVKQVADIASANGTEAVKITGNVLPTLGDINKVADVYEGTYTRTGQDSITVAAGNVGRLFWDGTLKSWSLQSQTALPSTTVEDAFGTSTTKGSSQRLVTSVKDSLYAPEKYSGTILNRYVNSGGTISIDSKYDSTQPIAVKKGDVITVSGTSGTTIPVLFGMNNADITLATVKQNLLVGSLTYNNVSYTINSDDITFVIASSRNASYNPPATVLLDVSITRGKFEILDSKINNIDVYSKKTYYEQINGVTIGQVIRSDTGAITTVSSQPNQAYSDFIPVTGGDEILISGLFSASVGVAGFNENKVFTSRISDSTSNSLNQVTTPNDFKIIIPAGVKFITISTVNNVTNPISVKVLKTLSEILKEVENPPEKLELRNCYYSVDIDGASGKEAIYVYSKLKNDLYIRFNVQHVYNMDDLVYLDYYRIVGASVYKMTKLGMVLAPTPNEFWTNAESEFTMQQYGKADHSGGYHGDEIYSDVKFLADGSLISLAADIPLTGCDSFQYLIKSTLHEAPNADTPNTPIAGHPTIATHFKNIEIRNNKIVINNSITFTGSIVMKRAYIGLICQGKSFAASAYNELGDYATFIGDNVYKLQNSGAKNFTAVGAVGGVTIDAAIVSINKPNEKLIQNNAEYRDIQPMYVHDRPADDKVYFALGYRSSTAAEVINTVVGESWTFKCEVSFK